MSRSVNKVLLIGNLTRDPEVRFTPQGSAVCSFSIATNRDIGTSDSGERKEVVDFHNLVAWNKLAELCGQLLAKGSKIYVEGRLQTRDWVGTDGVKKYKTEVVIDEMIVLSRRKNADGSDSEGESVSSAASNSHASTKEKSADEDINLDDVLADFDTSGN